MSEFYCYEGIRDNATFKLDSDTTTTIKDNPKDILGKIVTLTGNGEVGYGASGDAPLGVVAQVEYENNANKDIFVVSVRFNRTAVDVPCAGSETAGAYAACDGKGGIAVSADATTARVWEVNATAKTCTVYIHG